MRFYFIFLGLYLTLVAPLTATDLMLQNPASTTTAAPPATEQQKREPAVPLTPDAAKAILHKQLLSSSKAAEEWFNLVDEGKYGESWDQASLSTKMLLKRTEWITYLTAVRKPLGRMLRRTMLDQRIAHHPKGVPQADYMVFFYDSSFSNKSEARELLILQEGNNGTWHVFSYNVKGL